MKTQLTFSTAALVLATAVAASAAPMVKTVETANGNVLAGENGMTLYIFDKDSDGASACYDKCATNWPPFLVAEGETPDEGFSVVTRTDGHQQWAYDGKPLYYWKNDIKEGDITGDGVLGLWQLARP